MNLKEMTVAYVILGVMVFGASGTIGGFCWPYALNEWLSYAEKDTIVTFWQGFMLGFLPPLAMLSIVACLGTWIAMLFI